MPPVSDDELREMAQHRGLKLVRSRRRKPGAGDYGKFGLTDAAGNALLGIGKDELTASAQDIEDFLRKSELGTWKRSAETTPGRPLAQKKPSRPDAGHEDARARRRSGPRGLPLPVSEQPSAPHKEIVRRIRPTPSLRLVPRSEPEKAGGVESADKHKSKPARVPEPELHVRPVTSADSKGLTMLLNQLSGMAIKQSGVESNLAVMRKARAGLIVAELGRLVGCCGWSIIPSVHRGALGRLTVLVVDKAHRRRGIATAMLAAAEKALAKAGCKQVEALSDITIDNSHNFFRTLGFEQTSYRFIRDLGE